MQLHHLLGCRNHVCNGNTRRSFGCSLWIDLIAQRCFREKQPFSFPPMIVSCVISKLQRVTESSTHLCPNVQMTDDLQENLQGLRHESGCLSSWEDYFGHLEYLDYVRVVSNIIVQVRLQLDLEPYSV